MKVNISMLTIKTNHIPSVDFVDLTEEDDEVCLDTTIIAYKPVVCSSNTISFCPRLVPHASRLRQYPMCCYHPFIKAKFGRECSKLVVFKRQDRGNSPATWASWRLSWCGQKVPQISACHAIDKRPICCYNAHTRGFPGLGKKCQKKFHVFEHVADKDTGNCA